MHRLSFALIALCFCSALMRAGDLAPLGVELVTDQVNAPTFATAPSGDDRLFVLEQNSGKVVVIIEDEPAPLVFLDLDDLITPGGERGLLGLVFDPDYAENQTFYVTYNNLAGEIELARYRVLVSNPNRADPGSAEVLLSIPKNAPQHNGGALAFGNDGHLYLTTGDGSDGNDVENNAQSLDRLLGKVLRLDVSAGTGPYAIPTDNPFIDTPGARPEVFAYGLRNPWRMSIDRGTGDMWLGDVGQVQREEINRVPAGVSGSNFGWRCIEGTLCTPVQDCDCSDPTAVPPVYEYTHDTGCAVIGGRVYRGLSLPSHRGRFFFADYCTSRVWSMTLDDFGQVDSFIDHTSELLPPGIPSLGLISAIGADGFGELCICSHNSGSIYRMIPQPPAPDCDLDGIPDATEIEQGTAFDVNFNAVPDTCEPTIAIGPLIPGLTVFFEFFGAEAGQPVIFATSTRSIGDGPCFFNNKVCLSILQPITLSQPVFADSTGQISSPITVPKLFGQETVIFMQAITLDGNKSKVSAPLTKVYMP